MSAHPIPKVLVVGGGGFFGQLLVQELLQYTHAHITLASRNRSRLTAVCRTFESRYTDRVATIVMDMNQAESVKAALVGAQIVICAAGPYQKLSGTLVAACLDRGIDYVDLADHRPFVAKVHQLVKQRADQDDLPAVCTGWSAVPALSGVLASIVTQGLDVIESINIHIAPGNRSPRATSTVFSLLSSVGERFTVCRNGRWENAVGWSQPRSCEFPAPVGRRRGYLVDVPDHEIFPELFGASSVEFRVGSELMISNHFISFLAFLYRKGFVRQLASWSGFLRQAMALTSFIGHDWGAVAVEAQGSVAGSPVRKQASVVADRAGHRIPVMPAAIMTKLLLAAPGNYHGLVPVHDWLTRKLLELECERRGYRLVIQDGHDFQRSRK